MDYKANELRKTSHSMLRQVQRKAERQNNKNILPDFKNNVNSMKISGKEETKFIPKKSRELTRLNLYNKRSGR
jgi:hypothetical protein